MDRGIESLSYIQSLSYEEGVKLIQEALEELERMGLVKWTGKYRNGQPVYVATEYFGGTA